MPRERRRPSESATTRLVALIASLLNLAAALLLGAALVRPAEAQAPAATAAPLARPVLLRAVVTRADAIGEPAHRVALRRVVRDAARTPDFPRLAPLLRTRHEADRLGLGTRELILFHAWRESRAAAHDPWHLGRQAAPALWTHTIPVVAMDAIVEAPRLGGVPR